MTQRNPPSSSRRRLHTRRPWRPWPVRAHVLDNGLRVRVVEDHHLPIVAYFTLFHVGSRDEAAGQSGMAHLFEHLMFSGSAHFGPGQFDRLLEGAGGNADAYTTADVTCYFAEIPPPALELVIRLEADRMGSLELSLRALNTEKAIVEQERIQTVDSSPAALLLVEWSASLFGRHPYCRPTIGWPEDLAGITRPQCLAFFERYYAPSNATVWVVGDVDPQRVFSDIDKAYRRLPKRARPVRPLSGEEPGTAQRCSTLRGVNSAPLLVTGFLGPPAHSPHATALDVLECALAKGAHPLLEKALVERAKMVR
jgi:zinc protease